MTRLISNLGRVLLFAYLLWLPLPFGSVTHAGQVPLVLGAVLIFMVALLVPLRRARRGDLVLRMTPEGLIWAIGALTLIAVVLAELVPLPPPLVRLLSPMSWRIWTDSGIIRRLLDPEMSRRFLFPLTIDPGATRVHLARLISCFAVFAATSLLIRRQSHRLLLTAVLGCAAVFQVIYGLEHWARHSREIWGWENTLIHNRITGTFVNPNHYAHYLALILPLGLYLSMTVWRHARSAASSFPEVVARVIERHFFRLGAGLLLMFMCLGGILVSQSRGALLAAFLGVGSVLVARLTLNVPGIPDQRMSRGRRRRLEVARIGGLIFIPLAVAIAGLAFWIGAGRTLSRFIPTAGQGLTLVGRVIGARAALGVWAQFPLVGSGFGTFDRVVLMTQPAGFDRVFGHAHNDYLELLATTGVVGSIPAILALFAGAYLLARGVFGIQRRRGRRSAQESMAIQWGSDDHRMFRLAALISLTIAIIHAAFDFNFFIPANPATLAAILGAATATPHRVVRRDGEDDESPDADELEPV